MYGGPKYVEALVNARNASEAVDRSVDLPDLTIDTTGEVSTLEVTAARLSEALTPEHSPLEPVFEIGLMVANAFAHLADDLGVAHVMFRYPYTRVTHTCVSGAGCCQPASQPASVGELFWVVLFLAMKRRKKGGGRGVVG